MNAPALRALAILIVLTLGAIALAAFLHGCASRPQPPCSDCWMAL